MAISCHSAPDAESIAVNICIDSRLRGNDIVIMKQLQNPKIIYEDKCLLVIEKPAGLVVNRAQTVKTKTLQDWMDRKLNEYRVKPFKIKVRPYKEFKNRSGLVHRLDKKTSGLMVLAKTAEAFLALQAQFKQRTIIKKYLSLVHGKVVPLEGNIRGPIKRNPANPFRFAVIIGGRQAETNYKVLDYYENFREKDPGRKYYSLVEVGLKTGRTHQIRVHFSHLKYSVVADDIYCGRKTFRRDLQWCPRLFLHAFYLEFSHPESGKRIKFESELPKDLSLVLGRLSKKPKVSEENG